jgi:hypothetical protein
MLYASDIISKFECDYKYSIIVAIMDNDKELFRQMLQDMKLLPNDILKDLAFDYVIIFSKIHDNLMLNIIHNIYKVPRECILIWNNLKKYYEDKSWTSINYLIQQSTNFIIENCYKKVLDLGMGLGVNTIYNRADSRVNINDNIILDCYNFKNYKIYPILSNLYNNIYTQDITEKYEIASFMCVSNISLLEFEKVIEDTFSISRFLLVNISDGGSNPQEFFEWITYNYGKWGRAYKYLGDTTCIVLIDKEPPQLSTNLKIFVVTHKKFPFFLHEPYIPIQAGRDLYEELGYLADNVGENISRLNPLINECTALYWIWKHTNNQFVGLNHYRRFFLKNEFHLLCNIVDDETVENIMKEYDMILPCSYHDFPGTVKDGLLAYVSKDAVETGLSLVRDIIRIRQVEYIEAFDYVFAGNTFYMCNMFITKKDILNRYCEWLFDIIIEAAEKIDVSKYNSYSKRIIGFIAERLMTVWLIKNPYRIKELPLIVVK